MALIPLPQKPKFKAQGDMTGRFEINGCYPGYGTTLGNALRRVLLSSLEGAAITAVKIKGVSHEFSTLPGVMEDVVHIILNLKKVRFRMHAEGPLKVTLKSKGVGEIKASDVKCSSDLEVINADQVIATVTDKKANLEMEIEVSRGLGYVPVEQQKRENKEIGMIAIDAIYTPIERVNYTVEDMRVGKRTDYNRITLEIKTDGSVTPQEAFSKAVEILVNQFSALVSLDEGLEPEEQPGQEEAEEAKEEAKEEADPLKTKIEDLKGLSSRTLKALSEGGISKVKDIVKYTEDELGELKGLGEKGIKEIKKAIGELGTTLKSGE